MRIAFMFLLLIVFIDLNAQTNRNRNNLRLDEILRESLKEDSLAIQRVNEYLSSSSSNRIEQFDDGTLAILQDVVNGHPIYYAVNNIDAAVTVGTNQLHSAGSLGISLFGEGMSIGVWDGGFARDSHAELAGKITSGDGGAGLSDHATHVMGTILARGINESAKGMAPLARGISFDFNNDGSEMAARAGSNQGPLLVSNHSYGEIVGWRFDNGTWRWFGDESISDDEDYRFGFYSQRAALWDDIAFNAPFYTIVKSAGNDGDEVGDGSRSVDGPFDNIGTYGTAKNIITVGAIEKLPDGYTNSSDVQIASFSSWGPTDDGRIKPDIVGAGVGVFSSLADDDEAYGNRQGTSMSTPNVSGSILLLQELHAKLNGGNYMRSSTVKALLFHTANEAGKTGPDYVYGWGVMNAEGAARLLIDENNRNIIIDESNLENEEQYHYQFDPAPGSVVKATIVWTDPAATAAQLALDPTELRLINDLDIRISDGTNMYMPWVLDPSRPILAAETGDNFRDNVEQIVFTSEHGAPLELTISHKSQLDNDNQNFSLVLTYESDYPSKTFYWIGPDGGDWLGQNNWSLSSGGETSGSVPGADDVAIFDDNSFSAETPYTLTTNMDLEVGSIRWLSANAASLDLGGNELRIRGDFLAMNETLLLKNGSIVLKGNSTGSGRFSQNNVVFENIDLIADSEGFQWNFLGDLNVESFILNAGNVVFDSEQTIRIDRLLVTSSGESSIHLANSNFSIGESFISENPGFEFAAIDSRILIGAGDHVTIAVNDLELTSELHVEGALIVSGLNNAYKDLIISDGALITFDESMKAEDLRLGFGSEVKMKRDVGLEITGDLVVRSDADRSVSIIGSVEGSGRVLIDGHRKVCLDFLLIENVDFEGSASVSAGANSQLTNSLNWLTIPCEEVLFSDFSFEYACRNALTQFMDLSTGNISSWSWNFGDGASSQLSSPHHTFLELGAFAVTLDVKDASDQVESYTQTVDVIENTLADNRLVNNNGVLTSFQLSDSYQWYLDNQPIVGANSRSYNTNGQNGTYFVVTFDESCNVKSEEVEVVVSALDEPEHSLTESQLRLFPNPTKGRIKFSIRNDYLGVLDIQLLDLRGTQLLQKRIPKNDTYIEIELNLAVHPRGVYILRIHTKGDELMNRKVIVK